ncbi:kalirin isoform X1 [Silurus asotus]|uniref:Kalirin isoform X1 n=1 Tax=Silurus asotus TaxID=30991 RepID=A0AAD5B0H1_SILAS|nr:kalirin isoform X1 [Silurus asotus]
MFDWISHNKELFLQSHTEIGVSYQHAVDLQTQHNHFAMNSMNAYVNINRIMSVASRLSEAGHYASQQIKQISAQLDQEWKSFAAALDERSTILAMSAVFHQKSEQAQASFQQQLLQRLQPQKEKPQYRKEAEPKRRQGAGPQVTPFSLPDSQEVIESAEIQEAESGVIPTVREDVISLPTAIKYSNSDTLAHPSDTAAFTVALPPLFGNRIKPASALYEANSGN